MTKKYWKMKSGVYAGITPRGKRFMGKMTSEAARKKAGGTPSTSKTRKGSSSKKGVKGKMAKKRRRSSGFSISTAFKLIRLGAIAYPGVKAYLDTKNVANALGIYAGIGYDGAFKTKNLLTAWKPYLASILTTHGISKLSGMIRRL